MNSSSSTPVALVTGTSTGIGLETAVALARGGWDVVATVRDVSRADRLRDAATTAGVSLDIRALDVTDGAASTALVEQVVAERGRLDALVNNAGAAALGTAETMGIDRVRAAMEVNFFGVVQLTQAALPALRASGGRVVTVSSVGGIIGQPFNDAYCAAKFAVEGFMESLHPVAAAQGVAVIVVEPGAVASEFVANATEGRDAALADAGPYAPQLAAYLERTAGAFAAAQQPAEVAAVIERVLTEAEPPFRVQTSDAARAFVGIKLADLDGSAVTGATAAWVA
ncbi:SDR family oxidoreductase [Leifsonia naganoensis]|uniref:NAD(P)-dependent dehydrogenase (Short-subunit alcohol dehydrogenase family) n=1 Tax=Leifsonia naganoensis TaxID=150025 RepID=A0A853DW46_9MICO|nr:SDR family oxidoreductase [Leifsonia naganoensis]NYK10175.1 NAD(P)-dependent dehydrogenase (short-subunit alcohol dehydrogenase family) [Leifsonia naganoensis]